MSETPCAETTGFSLLDERGVSEHAQEPHAFAYYMNLSFTPPALAGGS